MNTDIITRFLVLQPSSFCNLDCSYCYVSNRALKARMSLDVLERILKWAVANLRFETATRLVWHSGEPLAVPIAFYREAAKIIERHELNSGITFAQSVQTNATTISEEWCQHFIENQIQVGVSLDGPQPVHDAARRYRVGKGSFLDAMRGVDLLKRFGIPLNVICVVSEWALDHPNELMRFFNDLDVQSVGFNLPEIEAVAQSSFLTHADTPERYRRFLSACYAFRGSARIRELSNGFQSLARSCHSIENGQVMPWRYVGFDRLGGIYTYSPEMIASTGPKCSQFCLGDVFQDSRAQIERTEKFQRMHREIHGGVENCRQSCGYFAVCGGGAPINKYAEWGSFEATQTAHCLASICAPIDAALDIYSAIRSTVP